MQSRSPSCPCQPPLDPRLLFSSDYLFKLLLIGDSGVGKSCLLLRFAVSIKPRPRLAAAAFSSQPSTGKQLISAALGGVFQKPFL